MRTVSQDLEYPVEFSWCATWGPACLLQTEGENGSSTSDYETSISNYDVTFDDDPEEDGGNDTRRLSGAEAWRLLSGLSKFLLSNTSLRQLYIIHDQSAGDVDLLVQESHLLGVDPIVLAWEDSLSLVETILRTSHHFELMRHIFLLCSTEQILHVFEQVRQRTLETPTVQWYVMAREPVAERLAPLLREGTQLSLAEPDGFRRYRLLATRASSEDTFELRLLGYWSLASSPEDLLLREPFFRTPEDLYSDFEGRRLTVAVVDNWPFFRVRDSPEEGGLRADSGIDVNILNALANKLNFTYQLTTPLDGQWGIVRPNGLVTGMIGMLVSREAHMAINEITITGKREGVIDFTYPYYLESATFASRAPVEKNRALAAFSPFTVEVWLTLVATVGLFGPLIYMIQTSRTVLLRSKSSTHDHELHELAFNVFRSLLVQQNRLSVWATSSRVLFAFWYLFGVIIYALYSGTLTATLAVPSFEKPLNSLEDLLKFTSVEGAYMCYISGTSYESLFQDATSGIYRDIYLVGVRPEVSHVPTSNAGLIKVLNEDFVYVAATLGLQIRINQMGQSKFHLAKENMYPQAYGIVCSRGSPYRSKFNKILARMIEAGLIGKWAQEQREMSRPKQDLEGGDTSLPTRVITLKHLQAAFFLLFIGFGVSFVVLVVEGILGRTSDDADEEIGEKLSK
ncbi:putative glutamate receptor [Oratosquilla oratoria]|uniref:putative glutamate receptor n=1 Tax=Oratosquilla oratoria TaxID=337810 RepID=UPI003F75797F